MNFRFLSSTRTVVPAISVLALAFSSCVSSRSLIEDLAKSPRHPIQDSNYYPSLNRFQQDFFYLTEFIRGSHAEPYAAWSKEKFDSEQARLLESPATDTNKASFEQSLQSFLSSLRDSHTSAEISWMGGQLQYPVSYLWIKDTLVLASVGRQQDTALIGSRVVAFNNLPPDEVFARFTQFIPYENVFQARRILQYYFVFPTFLREAGVIESDTLELDLVTSTGRTVTHRILPVEQPERVSHFESHPITKRVNRPFTYSILEDEKACYLQWNTMMDLRVARRFSFPTNLLLYPVAWYMGIGYFDNFLEDMFEQMAEEHVETLIIDLRGNGGGSSVYGEQLLYHLDVPSSIRTFSTAIRFSPLYREFFPDAYERYSSRYSGKFDGASLPDSLIVTSFFATEDSLETAYFRNVTNSESDYYIESDRTIFTGKVYFLVGESTYSSAIILSTLVKDNKLFTVVGQPTRGRPSHYGETLVLKLPHSGIVCKISCKKFFRPDLSKDAEDSLYPDVEIWPTFGDLKKGHDIVFDWVLQDAKEKATRME